MRRACCVVVDDEGGHPDHARTADGTGVGFRSERGPILIAIMVTTGLVAIDATILATAVPTIVADLGGFTSFPWLFSVYLLTQAVSVPIYSKLADTVGRKPVVLLGIGLFLLGSVLCGFAWSMPALIAFRAVQGLGAGAVQPMAITIAGDIYTVAERAKAQGYIASVWAISSVVGPTLGGVFSEFLSLELDLLRQHPAVPRGGLAAGPVPARDRRAHPAPHRLGGRRAAHHGDEPADPRRCSRAATRGSGCRCRASARSSSAPCCSSRSSASSSGPTSRCCRCGCSRAGCCSPRRWSSVGVGVILIGLTSYVPSFLEALLGVSPLTSGLTLAALTIGWPITASQSGRLYLRFGFRTTVLIGSARRGARRRRRWSSASTAPVRARASGSSCFVVGAGLGLVASPSLIAAQSSVGWGDRGGGHRRQPVLAVHGQRGRRRGARRAGQRA